MKKIKQILVLAVLPLVLVGCANKNKNTEVLEALNVEYNVPSGKVEEMTGYELSLIRNATLLSMRVRLIMWP